MNPNRFPLVSIIITSYNYERFISEAIESALLQDYPNIEIIISDNCSTDSTIEVINRYINDSRIRFNQNSSNIGGLLNFLKATNLAKGDYITFISADDYLVNNSFVSEAVTRFESIPSLMIVKGKNLFKNEITGKCIVDTTYTFWQKDYYNRPYIKGIKAFIDYPLAPSVGFGGSMFKRSVLVASGLGELGEKCFYMDAEVSLKLLLMGDISFINKDTYVNRLHGANSTGHRTANQAIENIIYIESPYQYAIDDGKIPLSVLNSWRSAMILQYFRGILKHFYIHNKNEYKKVRAYLKSNHNQIDDEISDSLNWKLFSIASKSSLLISLYPFLGRIKCNLYAIFRNLTNG